jgi:RNA polymerase sigma-70 factor (ECF subfamily)
VLLQTKDRYAAIVASAAMRPARGPVPIEAAVSERDPSEDLAADLELMRQVAANAPEAQRELVERVIGRVRARARKFTRTDADADDATQTAIMEVLRSATSYRGEGKLEAWCDRITVRTIVRQQRGRARAQARLTDVDPDHLEHPRASNNHVHDRGALRFLDELSDDRREVLQLRAAGYTIEEIATQTHASPNTVKDRLRMARRQLRQFVRQREAVTSIRSIRSATSIKSIKSIKSITSIKRKAT